MTPEDRGRLLLWGWTLGGVALQFALAWLAVRYERRWNEKHRRGT